jgi:hypothetical protein
MNLKWRKILILSSFAVILPTLTFEGFRAWRRWRSQEFKPDGHSVAKCERCMTLLQGGAGTRLIMHLTEDHKLEHNAAIETVDWIFKSIAAHRAMKEGARVSN